MQLLDHHTVIGDNSTLNHYTVDLTANHHILLRGNISGLRLDTLLMLLLLAMTTRSLHHHHHHHFLLLLLLLSSNFYAIWCKVLRPKNQKSKTNITGAEVQIFVSWT